MHLFELNRLPSELVGKILLVVLAFTIVAGGFFAYLLLRDRKRRRNAHDSVLRGNHNLRQKRRKRSRDR